MDSILDGLFSSVLFGTIFIMVTMFLFVGLGTMGFNGFLKTKTLNTILSVVMFTMAGLVLFFFSVFNGQYFGYGYAFEFDQLMADEKYTCFLDNRPVGGSEGDEGIPYYRLHTLNTSTGKRISRKILGEQVSLLSQENGILFYSQAKNLVFWDIEKGAIKTELNKESLVKQFPEFVSGIDEFNYDSNDNIIQISAKNGKKYFMEPYSFLLKDKKPESRPKIEKAYWVENNVLRQNNQNGYSLLQLEGKEGADKIKRIVNSKREALNPELEFLEGKLLQVFPDTKQFLILHYTSTDKSEFILSSVSFDLKLLWQIKQGDLITNDYYTVKAEFNVSATAKNDFIFSVGGFVFSINTETGKLNWQNRL